MITKVCLDIADSKIAANVVTMKFEESETVADAIVKIAAKVKAQLSKEEVLSRFALVYKGIPAARYFQQDASIIEYLTNDCLKVCYFHFFSTLANSSTSE